MLGLHIFQRARSINSTSEGEIHQSGVMVADSRNSRGVKSNIIMIGYQILYIDY